MIISHLRNIGLALMVSGICSVALAREWTSSNGKFKIEAEFVAVKDGKVVLEKPDGTYVSVPLSMISKKDIEYIEATTGKKVDGGEAKDSEEMTNKEDSNDDTADREETSNSVAKPKTIKLKGSKSGDPPGVVREFGEQGWGIKCLAFSGNGAHLFAGKSDEMVAVFDVNEGSRLNITKRLDDLGSIEALAVSQDGTRLAAGGYKGIVKTWKVSPTGGLKDGKPFAGHSESVTTLAVSADGRFALSGSRDKTVKYWQFDTGKEFASFEGFDREVKAVWISPDGTQAKATDGESLARIDLKAKESEMVRVQDSASPQFAAFSPDGRLLAINDGSSIRLWDLDVTKELPLLKSNEIQWIGVFTPDSQRLVSGANGVINVWDVNTQKRVGALTNEGVGYVQAIAASPDGEHISGCSSGAGVVLRVFRLPPP